MTMQNHFFEAVKLLHHNPADSQTVAQDSGWLDFSPFHEVAVLVSVGDIVATGTLDGTAEQATSAAGAGATPILDRNGAALAFTQLTAAGGDSNQMWGMSILPEYLDVDNDFHFFEISITPATAAAEIAIIILGLHSRFLPIDAFAADYAEVVLS